MLILLVFLFRSIVVSSQSPLALQNQSQLSRTSKKKKKKKQKSRKSWLMLPLHPACHRRIFPTNQRLLPSPFLIVTTARQAWRSTALRADTRYLCHLHVAVVPMPSSQTRKATMLRKRMQYSRSGEYEYGSRNRTATGLLQNCYRTATGLL